MNLSSNNIITTKSNTILSDHIAHMRNLLTTVSLENPVTVSALFGDADPTEGDIAQATKIFVKTYRNLNLRIGEIEAFTEEAKKAKKVSERAALAAISDTIPDDRQTDSYRWVDGLLDQYGCTVDCAANVKHHRYDAHKLLLALITMNADRPEKFGDNVLKAAYQLVLEDRRQQRLVDLFDSISAKHLTVRPSIVMTRLNDLMSLALDNSKTFTTKEASMLLCKFIWQVKRKMAKLPVTRHTMLVFVGAQEGGKSGFVEAICSPLNEVTANTNMQDITDIRNISLFSNYIGTIDELDRMDRTSVDSLKKVITDKLMSRRIMGTNDNLKIEQNMTFIGTSNRDISEVIIDETGNRRFIQLTVISPTSPDRNAFWKGVRDFDWLSLWRAVDETADDPTTSILDKISNTQKAERNLKTPLIFRLHRTSLRRLVSRPA